MGSTPVEHRIIVMAMMAALLCTHIVSTEPMSRNVMVVTKLFGSNEEKKSSTGWLWARSMSMPVWRSVPRPRSMKLTPKRKSPIIFRFFE